LSHAGEAQRIVAQQEQANHAITTFAAPTHFRDESCPRVGSRPAMLFVLPEGKGEAVQKSVSVTGGVTHVYEKTSSQASA